jgi:hypothetical protein
VDLYPLPGTPQPGPVDAGWVQAIRRGPSTIAEVLERARLAAEAEDEAEAYRADPIAYVRAHRPRRRLIDVLLRGRGP